MRTRYIPAGVMLMGGAVSCIISIVQKQDIIKSLITLLVVLILFYIIGYIAKFFVEKILKDFSENRKNKDIDDDIEKSNHNGNEESSVVENSPDENDVDRL